MQIVRDLGGYSLGRSDLVRRAMSKKKTSVMEKERKNFIYGNEEEGVCGCIANGISEAIANKIYDEMMDFARYAFNKSHAAAYAVVSYQTAWLKYYYPTEFMAALMTSVIDNTSKISEYVLSCRQMGIKILPPDINEGEWDFTTSENSIRFGLSAIKSIGKNVVISIMEERNSNGPFLSLKDFIDRLGSKEINKRSLENFIKSGAMDSLSGTRKQKIAVYKQLIDQKTRDQKNSISGQISLFDYLKDENADISEEFQINFPDIGEYDKDTMLIFEKECLGIYISGHPMDSWIEQWKKQISATSSDFKYTPEIYGCKVDDQQIVIAGGIVTSKSIKITKNNTRMAFITLEDVNGSIEVVIFPRDLEKYEKFIEEDSKIFIKGKVDADDNADAKLICIEIIPLENVPKRLWICCKNRKEWDEKEKLLYDVIDEFPGITKVSIYLSDEKAKKTLSNQWRMTISDQSLNKCYNIFTNDNVKVIDMPIEK